MKVRIAALLLLVAAAGYVSTSGLAIDPWRFGLLMLTGFLASAGASAINHYIDRDLDSLMGRTRARPLPAHRIEPPGRALGFGLGLSLVALGVAYLGLNPLTAGMIGLGLFVYVGVYTLGLKRTHASNIVIGGFAGSCPALAGSAAAVGVLSAPAILLAVLVFLWTPGHFWALAYRSREDYRRAGIPMLPAVSDERTTVRAIAVSTALVPVATLGFYLTPAFGLPFLVAAALGGGILLALTWRFVRRPSVETAWAGYKFSGTYLAIVLVGAMLDAVVAHRLVP
ncbi:MAG: protoheme IX farnesyltransferase [Euryarchaeota archaeon RBG_19FT_COMBO_69_17]|nr:MAG: protoheme IX farnesyltransferase [Euryarchaeota archaeon RBG_19FT_COMBO_69_17]